MTETSTDQVQKLGAVHTTEQAVADGGSDAVSAAIRESLSALVDSEASELEVRRLLKLAESNPDIQNRWRRYQLVRSVIKGELNVNPQFDLAARISTAIAEEPPLQMPSGLRRWRHGAGKVAVAASVTFIFILGVQQFGPKNLSTSGSVESALGQSVEVAGGAPAGFELPPFAARTVSTDANFGGLNSHESSAYRSVISPQLLNHYSQALDAAQLQNNQALQDYFNHLLFKHAERSSSNGSMGLIPFARISRMDAARE